MIPDEKPSRTFYMALVVAGAAFLLRLVWVLCAEVTQLSDFALNEELAVRWLSTGCFGFEGSMATRSPGYPGFVAVLYAVFGHSPGIVGLAQALLGGLTSGLLVLLAARILPIGAAAIAGVLHAVSPTSLAYVPVLASENLALPLLVGGLLCLSRGNGGTRQGTLRLAGAGLLLGALVLVRPAGVFFLPGVLLLAAYSPLRRVWSARGAVAVALGAMLLVSPWLLRNIRAGLGPALSTLAGPNLWEGNNPHAQSGGYCAETWNLYGLKEREQNAAYERQAIQWILGHPGRYCALCGKRLVRLLGTEPDVWAAMYLTPTTKNDWAISRHWDAWEKGLESPPVARLRSERVQSRNMRWLRAWRVAVVPFLLVGAGLSFLEWRRYAYVVWPALCYIMGIALTIAEPRYRDLSEPLLLIPLAGFIWRIGGAYVGRAGAGEVQR